MKTTVKQYGAGASEDKIKLDTDVSSEQVEKFHLNADTDVRDESIHLTLGPNPGQAAPGDHNHDGGTSAYLLSDFSIQTSASISAWRLQVEAALARLGATIQP